MKLCVRNADMFEVEETKISHCTRVWSAAHCLDYTNKVHKISSADLKPLYTLNYQTRYFDGDFY